MRIAVFLVDQVYANTVAKSLVEEFGREIKFFVESAVLLPNRSPLNGLRRYLKISGFYYVVVQAIKVEIYRIISQLAHLLLPSSNKFYSYRQLVRKRNIPIIREKNINSAEMLNILKKKKIDLIVSVFFNQILSKQVIKIPKKGVINLHPAYLPHYKGTGPIFWSLVNNEKFVGVTVHFIDEGIDTGKIISRKQIKVNNSDTEDSLYWKSTLVGVPLLISSIKSIKENRVVSIENKGGKCFQLPTKEAVSKFKKQGKKFFNLKSFLLSH